MDMEDVILQVSIVTLGMVIAQIFKLIVDAIADLIFGRDE